MRLSCLQENLSRGLTVVGRAIAARTTLPITQNVLLETDDSRLKLAATNLEIAISKALKSSEKTFLLVIYNNQNQRRYIGVKLN